MSVERRRLYGACPHARRGTGCRCQTSSLTSNVSDHVEKSKYLGQIIASDGKVQGEVSRSLALGYAAFNQLGKRGIWRDKSISRRTKLTLYKVMVRTILL
jgi:hypothetical protein